MKLLIVDDNIMTCMILKSKLKKYFDTVDFATDGETAYNLWSKNKYNIVITDVLMPKMNGYKLIELIYKEDKDKKTKVVILSSEPTQNKEIILQTDAYFLKPFDQEEFIARIRVLI